MHKDDLLMVIDPTDYRIAVELAEAAVKQTQALADNAQVESVRREKLGDWASQEERQTFASNAMAAQATHRQAVGPAGAGQRQPQTHAHRVPGQRLRHEPAGTARRLRHGRGEPDLGCQFELVLVDGYFEETVLASIRIGDPAKAKLMGYSDVITGHVAGVARGIDIENATSDQSGLAKVNPIFTWVRLAQRIRFALRLTMFRRAYVSWPA